MYSLKERFWEKENDEHWVKVRERETKILEYICIENEENFGYLLEIARGVWGIQNCK